MNKRNVTSVFFGVAFALATLPSLAHADLIISEYVEGSSNNKAIEIWNNTGGPVDLAAGAYKIQLFSNGSPTASATFALTGVLANNDAYVVAHPSAGAALLALADATSGTAINFNGDDAVALVKSAANTFVDVFGQVGFDPGTNWGAGSTVTVDRTLRRKPSVCAGDVVGSDVFDPSIEWDGFAVDTFSDLGLHTDNCGPVPATVSSWGAVKTLYR